MRASDCNVVLSLRQITSFLSYLPDHSADYHCTILVVALTGQQIQINYFNSYFKSLYSSNSLHSANKTQCFYDVHIFEANQLHKVKICNNITDNSHFYTTNHSSVQLSIPPNNFDSKSYLSHHMHNHSGNTVEASFRQAFFFKGLSVLLFLYRRIR